jgi:small subunit ribosomal protein S6|tara:strand:+ start:1008 stop:1337 length:330 start_codon:yes stop_codon:yes gene_type:complete
MNTIREISSYETICIVKPDLNEDNIAKIIETYQLMLVEKGAQNIVTQNRGRRHLKYTMKKFKDGIYIQMNYEANGEVISLLEKNMRIDEQVLRFMTVKNYVKDKAAITV